MMCLKFRLRMERGKSKANGGQGKGGRVKSKGEQDKTVNFKDDHAPQASSHDEGGGNRQLATFQDSSRRCEGRGAFASDMFEDPFFKDPFFTHPFGEPLKSSGLCGSDGIFNHEIFDMGRWPGKLLDQFQFNNPPSVGQKELLHVLLCIRSYGTGVFSFTSIYA